MCTTPTLESPCCKMGCMIWLHCSSVNVVMARGQSNLHMMNWQRLKVALLWDILAWCIFEYHSWEMVLRYTCSFLELLSGAILTPEVHQALCSSSQGLYLSNMIICSHYHGQSLPRHLILSPAVLPCLVNHIPKTLILNQCSSSNMQQPIPVSDWFWIFLVTGIADPVGTETQRSVSSTKANLMICCLCPEIAPKTIAKKPSDFIIYRMGNSPLPRFGDLPHFPVQSLQSVLPI